MTAEYSDDKKLCWLCPDGKDNHFWDCEVMALVAAYELDLRNWKRPAPKPRQTRPGPARSCPHSAPPARLRSPSGLVQPKEMAMNIDKMIEKGKGRKLNWKL